MLRRQAEILRGATGEHQAGDFLICGIEGVRTCIRGRAGGDRQSQVIWILSGPDAGGCRCARARRAPCRLIDVYFSDDKPPREPPCPDAQPATSAGRIS